MPRAADDGRTDRPLSRARTRQAGSQASCAYQVDALEQRDRDDAAVAALAPDPVVDDEEWRGRTRVERAAVTVERQRNHDEVVHVGVAAAISGVHEFNV